MFGIFLGAKEIHSSYQREYTQPAIDFIRTETMNITPEVDDVPVSEFNYDGMYYICYNACLNSQQIASYSFHSTRQYSVLLLKKVSIPEWTTLIISPFGIIKLIISVN